MRLKLNSLYVYLTIRVLSTINLDVNTPVKATSLDCFMHEDCDFLVQYSFI